MANDERVATGEDRAWGRLGVAELRIDAASVAPNDPTEDREVVLPIPGPAVSPIPRLTQPPRSSPPRPDAPSDLPRAQREPTKRSPATAGPTEDPNFADKIFKQAAPARKKPRFMPPPKLICGGVTDVTAELPAPSWDRVAEEFGIPDSWKNILAPLVETQRFAKTLQSYNGAKKSGNVLPSQDQIFAWARYCAPHEVKVIIVGQDPYPTEGDAHGLAFSVPVGRRVPPSLRRVFAALKDCYGDGFPTPSSGSLIAWAKQGVLLLNRHLTVERGLPRSHVSMGWDKLTFGVIKTLANDNPRMAVMLWGYDAKTFVPKLPSKHLRLEYSHPSTSTRRPFDCRHFIEANKFLEEGGLQAVVWRLP
ncbi:uracil DNA glycosylate [Psittacid alphaherpesvirus 1]|uniref:Uracil-DNA glycosylase n=1 Tax=Psittacid herpesvirus 1 (isolate Amazon parrot/-/97-0001/1997) TaxID=670426 RepID=UNG_PSHV1|nr:uracil-DNA glycosylase [Psittacid alphaherpesvirus 1]Q6UDG6.1 RecName: Full=Uracil-DNA glycosylase; Short=UDG; AltName: Full=UNG [Psittacid herpesvirus 1 Amazon parrot/1997]AAQ73744.1 uracil DNA glycosylate [Psittacid alphaherpesvirus 1]